MADHPSLKARLLVQLKLTAHLHGSGHQRPSIPDSALSGVATPSPFHPVCHHLITRLSLEDCQHTRIGGDLQRGISGGEAKRCNVGVSLIARPRVLLLDEPTSGLDSFSAHSVVSGAELQPYCKQPAFALWGTQQNLCVPGACGSVRHPCFCTAFRLLHTLWRPCNCH